MRYLLARLDKKNKLLGNFEKIFENYKKVILRKLRKCIILADFSQILRKHALIFCAFWRKRQVIENFEKFFDNF